MKKTGWEKEDARILVMTAAGLGDFIMTIPAIKAIRAKYPKAHITAMLHCERGLGQLKEFIPQVDEIIDFPLKKYSWGAVIRFFLWPFWKMRHELKKKEFDAIIIFRPNPVRAIIAKLLFIPCYVAEQTGYPIKDALDLVNKMGCDIADFDCSFTISSNSTSKLDNLKRPLIGIQPYSAMGWKSWDNYMELVEMLSGRNCTIVLLGKEASHKPVTGNDRVVDMVNKLTVKELVEVISGLDVLVSCDSGPMHIGFAANVPTVGVFTVIEPKYVMPANSGIKHRAVCSDCANNRIYDVRERKQRNIKVSVDTQKIFESISEVVSI